MTALNTIPTIRPISHKTRGRGSRGIVRLMSPSDLGQIIKPFVFLDLIDMESSGLGEMPLHPHSGIATVTVVAEGDMRFDDPSSGSGTIGYGGVEWMRAGGGVWHGKEVSPGISKRIKAFQLWLALPPELENGPVESVYLEADKIPSVGPARLIVGSYDGVSSPVQAPEGINYLLVTLKAGETWTYTPPVGHFTAFVALAAGAMNAGDDLVAGDMAVFGESDRPISFHANGDGDTVFVIGSAVPHPHELVLGYYSVHTSNDALQRGEAKIAEIGARIPQDLGNGRSTVPVFAG